MDLVQALFSGSGRDRRTVGKFVLKLVLIVTVLLGFLLALRWLFLLSANDSSTNMFNLEKFVSRCWKNTCELLQLPDTYSYIIVFSSGVLTLMIFLRQLIKRLLASSCSSSSNTSTTTTTSSRHEIHLSQKNDSIFCTIWSLISSSRNNEICKLVENSDQTFAKNNGIGDEPAGQLAAAITDDVCEHDDDDSMQLRIRRQFGIISHTNQLSFYNGQGKSGQLSLSHGQGRRELLEANSQQSNYSVMETPAKSGQLSLSHGQGRRELLEASSQQSNHSVMETPAKSGQLSLSHGQGRRELLEASSQQSNYSVMETPAKREHHYVDAVRQDHSCSIVEKVQNQVLTFKHSEKLSIIGNEKMSVSHDKMLSEDSHCSKYTLGNILEHTDKAEILEHECHIKACGRWNQSTRELDSNSRQNMHIFENNEWKRDSEAEQMSAVGGYYLVEGNQHQLDSNKRQCLEIHTTSHTNKPGHLDNQKLGTYTVYNEHGKEKEIGRTEANLGLKNMASCSRKVSVPDTHIRQLKKYLPESAGIITSKQDSRTLATRGSSQSYQHGSKQENVSPFVYEKQDSSTQTRMLQSAVMSTKGTVTRNPQLVEKSVGTQKLFKFVRNSDTMTSGPFMKKLRRAKRLLKEAIMKMQSERQEKVNNWREVMVKYKDRIKMLSDSLDKKDKLLSYTALNRALSENEVKDMCTSVSSARDRLLTQCKLNFALKEVVESKCEAGKSDL